MSSSLIDQLATSRWRTLPLVEASNIAAINHAEEISHIIAAEAELYSHFSHADTLIWLHRPDTPTSKMTCDGVSYPSQWLLRFSSKILRDSGFEKFPQLLDNKRYQRTTANMLRSSGYAIPPGVDYILDLGPSDDFELRSEHLEALSLPKGIVQYSALTRVELGYRVPFRLAGAHDDACQCFTIQQQERRKAQEREEQESRKKQLDELSLSLATQHSSSNETTGGENGTGKEGGVSVATTVDSHTRKDSESRSAESESKPNETKEKRPDVTSIWELPLEQAMNIADYCEVRHAANVIRLLIFMAFGRPLLLDSAARVYTVCGLVKLFGGCGDSPFQTGLRTQVYDWFYNQSNSVIVDVLPEECFRMAWNVQLPTVTRMAFRILVAERALRDAGEKSTQPRTYSLKQVSAFGRELAGLDDDTETLLDHASEALTQRVENLFSQIRSPESLMEAYDLPTYRMLIELQRWLAYDVLPRMNDDTVRAAQAAIQALLAKYSAILTGPILDQRLDTKAAERRTDTIMYALQLYVRREFVPRDFLAGYGILAEPQKHITSTYWYLLHQAIHTGIIKAVDDLRQLVGHVNVALTHIVAKGGFYGSVDYLVECFRAVCGPDVFTRTQERPTATPQYAFVRWEDIRSNMHSAVLTVIAKFYDRAHFKPELELNMLDPSPHLMLSLTRNEFRFLPLWAGGEDDGTGAVFQEPLPMAQLGPIGPGPAYHTGTTNATTSAAPSTMDGMSMVAASVSNADREDNADGLRDDDTDVMSTSSFVVVQDLGKLALNKPTAATRTTARTVDTSHNSRAVDDGLSTATDGASVMTPAHTEPLSSDMVLVDANDVRSTSVSASMNAVLEKGDQDGRVFQGSDDDEFDYEDEDIDFDDAYDDGDDDARSDHTMKAEDEEGGGSSNRDGSKESREKQEDRQEYDMVDKPDSKETAGQNGKAVQL